MIDHLSFTQFFCEIRAWKISGLNRIPTHDLCDSGAVLYQLSYQQIIIKPSGTELAKLIRKDHIIIAITAMIDHVFRTFSAVKTYELSYIHLH